MNQQTKFTWQEHQIETFVLELELKISRIFIGRVNFILNSVVPINGGKKEKKKKNSTIHQSA